MRFSRFARVWQELTETASSRLIWFPILAIAAFLLHAANYFYFFVDDEGIPFVYARNLLAGRGLTYSSVEGHVEGYSNFLMVLVDSVILACTRLVHAPLIAVFFVGKLLSLTAGIALIWTIGRYLVRHYTLTAAVGGAAILVLAGPVAVWCCSSLEAALVALTLSVFALSLVDGGYRTAAICGILLVLLRIDGFLIAGAALTGAMAAGTAPERRRVLRRVVVPILFVSTVYHGWRAWYFGTILSTPFEAKVLYKLNAGASIVRNEPAANYLVRFGDLYGAAFLVAVALGWIAVRRTRRGAALFVPVALLSAYAATVGDWMFGFRFFVPVIPLLAILAAEALDGVGLRRPSFAWVAAIACALWSLNVAVRFASTYSQMEDRASFLQFRSLEPARFFAPYWSVFSELRSRVPPGTLIADNQAGFVPFMLDAENLDTLGICSKLFAELPTRDLVFTEVGHYAPLSNKDVRTAGLNFLLALRPAYLLERTDLLEHANRTVPSAIFADRYKLLFVDSGGTTAVYTPRDESFDEFRNDPSLFLENVMHIAHLSHVTQNGSTVAPSEYESRLPFLRERGTTLHIEHRYSLLLTSDTGDVPVYELHIESLRASAAGSVSLRLWSQHGQRVHEARATFAARQEIAMHVRLAAPVLASRAMLEITSSNGEALAVTLGDVRVQGQPPVLEQFVRARIPVTDRSTDARHLSWVTHGRYTRPRADP